VRGRFPQPDRADGRAVVPNDLIASGSTEQRSD
jgi:hypothetical protein